MMSLAACLQQVDLTLRLAESAVCSEGAGVATSAVTVRNSHCPTANQQRRTDSAVFTVKTLNSGKLFLHTHSHLN